MPWMRGSRKRRKPVGGPSVALPAALGFALAALAALATAAAASPRPGTLDPGFGDGGLVRTPAAAEVGSSYQLVATARAEEGKQVAAIQLDHGGPAMVLRYLANGKLDPGFGDGGKTPIPGLFVVDLTVDHSDRILLAANGPKDLLCESCGARVMRLLPDGSPDPSFGEAGVVSPDFGFDPLPFPPNFTGQSGKSVVSPPTAAKLRVDRSGRIVLAGTIATAFYSGRDHTYAADEAPLVGRLFDNGQVDHSFGADGAFLIGELTNSSTPWVNDLEIDSAERPLVAICSLGQQLDDVGGALVRLGAEGSRDTHFGSDGIRATDGCPKALTLDRSERILALVASAACTGKLASSTPVHTAVACPTSLERRRRDGSRDLSFGSAGGVLPRANHGRLVIWQDVAVDGRARIDLTGVIARRLTGEGLDGRFYPMALLAARRIGSGKADRRFGRRGQAIEPLQAEHRIAWGTPVLLTRGPRGRLVAAASVAYPGSQRGWNSLVLVGFRG